MNQISKVLLCSAMTFSLCACSSSNNEEADSTGSASAAEGSDTLTGTYSVHIGGYDWGCGTDKVIITLDNVLDAITADDLKVTETKQTTDFTAADFPIIETTVDRTITDAYLCDENGEKVEEASNYVALELYVSPNDGSPLLFSMTTQLNTWSDPYYLSITTNDGASLTSAGTAVTSFTVDETLTSKTTDADNFEMASFTASDGVNYNYASYEVSGSDTLVVWLHGLGEGGTENTDPSITLLANKVTALAGEEFQSAVGNASILVPQCPTYWMDNDGQGTNFNNGSITADGTSYYAESLNELIDSYKEECGASKVVLAGCSNGGYMTMVMAIANPDKYDAIVPICEALPDQYITDEQIDSIKDLPMYFIYSEDDTTVDPTLHEIPTIERLNNAGASDLHVSTTEHVVDTSGNYTDEDGNAYQYMGHWSWIYFDNNESECDDCGIQAWQWIGETLSK